MVVNEALDAAVVARLQVAVITGLVAGFTRTDVNPYQPVAAAPLGSSRRRP